MAQSTIRKLYDVARSLKRFPSRGRVGHKEGTRELIVAPTPYIIGVEPEIVHILRVFHASMERR
jgi:toxin ParE1/3/4